MLKGVSRSFYLTIRLLPTEMRKPVGIAYLLARASDTVADTEMVSVTEREDLLRSYGEKLSSQKLAELEIEHFVPFVEDAREQLLMHKLGEIQDNLESLSADNQSSVHNLMEKILKGQLWDLTYFPQGRTTTVPDKDKLLEYTYLVAGSVGEFWTDIGFENFPGYCSDSYSLMWERGRHYGQALQLVNILRDVGKDESLGRMYLKPEWEAEMLQLARQWLDEGLRYCESLGTIRLRTTTALPALLGHKTLDLLETAAPFEKKVGVKVSRSQVYASLGNSFARFLVPPL